MGSFAESSSVITIKLSREGCANTKLSVALSLFLLLGRVTSQITLIRDLAYKQNIFIYNSISRKNNYMTDILAYMPILLSLTI